MCTEDKFLKNIALDLGRANEIDRDLDHFNLSVEHFFLSENGLLIIIQI